MATPFRECDNFFIIIRHNYLIPRKLEIEYNICKKDNNELKFEKYRFIYDNL